MDANDDSAPSDDSIFSALMAPKKPQAGSEDGTKSKDGSDSVPKEELGERNTVEPGNQPVEEGMVPSENDGGTASPPRARTVVHRRIVFDEE